MKNPMTEVATNLGFNIHVASIKHYTWSMNVSSLLCVDPATGREFVVRAFPNHESHAILSSVVGIKATYLVDLDLSKRGALKSLEEGGHVLNRFGSHYVVISEEALDNLMKRPLEKTEGIHYHKHDGVLHACFHKCRNALTDYGFWIGLTLGFPLEHFLWEKVWPFYIITNWLGL